MSQLRIQRASGTGVTGVDLIAEKIRAPPAIAQLRQEDIVFRGHA